MDDRESIEQFLRVGVFETSFRSVPTSTFKIETMNQSTFVRYIVDSSSFDSSIVTVDDFFVNLSSVVDFIK
jgi:hypothetical protein